MEFCGRCGKEFDRSLERGRFCASCGHENPGNARYPLYAEGAGTATAVALPRIADAGVTSVRMAPVPANAASAPVTTSATSAAPARSAEPISAWRTTLLSSLVAMLVVVLLGAFLLFH
jgi:hypothetical protein